ncbi:D-sedoheptulose-7-phosphate isomerase [Methylophilus methylotrophus]|uniref:D-sedoheptulose-7-phosphate isomerase n=1 Tax=Methylophilus methylotrophus TaxID=17 RepID=UPI0015AFEF7C|nr:SIS domain-containing protein [Methylophilus methylotrophus]
MSFGLQEDIKTEIEDSISVKQALLKDHALLAKIETLAIECQQALISGGKIIFAGNGGSFADAQHLSAEFTSRFQFDRAPLASIALGTNNSSISAIGNDYGYEQVFARELLAIAKPQDIYIPITTSGNSSNILESIKIANANHIKTLCLTGEAGGQAKNLCDCMQVPSNDTARIQECHILIGHILCGQIERMLFSAEYTAISKGLS